ncbi:hypothetical protein CDD80_184 [Ophiocordyceps camponoti-rufipedis]|uniref:Uncharacterized protein n=1 Tax=Ophiocordyceps camponoti-rufipedis TaxID=2004952 RepID=A0A2C5ZD67_9HYPO|nr:hypothetical protein CDD80_184 [Ophiocordyceps camponoti-rufipedis]
MLSGSARLARPRLRQLTSRISSSQSLLSTVAQSSARTVGDSISIPPSTQPPSARPIETRKSQLLRTYTSLLRSTPVILLFQHINLTSQEWGAVRRELSRALAAVPASDVAGHPELYKAVHLQVLTTTIFKVALKITELYNPQAASSQGEALTHDLSKTVYDAIRALQVPPESSYAQLEPLMVGPLAALLLPAVSPAYLSAALSVLAPVPGKFPAPTRRKCPSYHDPVCQSGLAKLILFGGRVERRILDRAEVDWVAGLTGGLDGLRGQLVSILNGAGLGLTTTLESSGRSIWLALEGRKSQLEEEKTPDKHARVASPDSLTSPRPSHDATRRSPPLLQHPQPQRAWAGALDGHAADIQGGGGPWADEARLGPDPVSEFDTSLGIRLDYEACLAYVALPPLGAIVLLVLERNSDYVRFHAWQAALLFTVILVLHIVISPSSFLSWLLFFADVGLAAFLALKAYRDAENLDRFEVPFFGAVASRILDDE